MYREGVAVWQADFMAGVTDLEITYGSALAPAGYRKVTLPDGGQAELNRGCGKLPSFLWYHIGAGRGDPIVEIILVHEDGAEREGYEKIPRNILKGSGQSAYIYIRRGVDVDPIGDIRVLYGSNPPDDGFERVEPSVIPTGDPVFLTVKHVSRDGPVKWSGFSLKVGDWCDALDSINNWCVAQIVEADANVVKVHFKGWASKWDEVVSRASAKLAELGTHTSGKDTGWGKRVQGNLCKYTAGDLENLREMMHRKNSDGGSPSPADELSDFNQIRDVAETILISSHDPHLVPLMNAFLRDVLTNIAKDLASEMFSMGQQQLLFRLFLLDENFSWYYDHYGLGNGDDGHLTSSDAILEGPVSKSQKTRSMLGGVTGTDASKLLITNLNHFGQAGGFAAIARLVAMTSSANSPNPRLALSEVNSLVAIIKGVSPHFTKKFSASYLPEFQLAVSRRLDAVACDKDLREMIEGGGGEGGHTTAVEAIWRDLGVIVRSSWKDFPFHERYESYLLFLARVFMTSPYLNLRIRGIALLNEQIDKLRRKEEAKQRSSYGTLSYYSVGSRPILNQNEPTLHWLTPSYLCGWMVDNQIMELALGDPTALQKYNLTDNHDEILKRSQDGLLFLATRSALTPSHLHLLWRSAGHSSAESNTSAPLVSSPSTVKVVYRVLTSLSERLPSESLSLLFDLIQKLTLPLDEAQVGLLRGVIENATRTLASGSKPVQHDDAGFHILWESVIGTNMDPQILQRGVTPTQIAAAEALASILSKSTQLRKTMQNYLEKSVNFIRGTFPHSTDLYASRGVETMATLLGSMQFIRKIVEAQPEASKGLPPKYALSREQVIKMTEDSYHLISALMTCIGFGVTQLSVDVSARSLFLESSLKFLEFVLVNSHLELDFEKVLTLWEHFHSTNQETDCDTFFHWIQTILIEDTPAPSSALNNSYYSYNRSSSTQSTVTRRKCVTDDAIERFFFRLFHEESAHKGYPMSTLSPLAYAALEKLFRHINGKHTKLSHYANKIHFVVNVAPLELSGMHVLFRAYTQAADPSLAVTISEFIILLQTKLAVSLEKKKVWVQFTKHCMDRIHSFAPSASHDGDGNGDPVAVASRKLHISRILQLLAKFFHEIASNQSHSYSTATGTMAMAASSSLRLSVFWKREGTNTSTHNNIVYVFQKGSVTVGALRARVARDLKVSPHHLRLMNSGRLILSAKHDEYPLESSGVSSFVDAIILRNPLEDTKHFKANQIRPATTLAEDPNSEQMFPRKILSDSNTHLSLMFELLSDPSPEVSQSAWDLLDLLPTNSSLLLHMKSLGGIISPDTFTITQADAFPNWEQLISEGGLLKQRYNLMIISSLLAPLTTEFSSEDEIQKSLLWGKHFIHFGGVKYLLQLLLLMRLPAHDSNEVTERSQLEQSLVLLLQLLSQFLVTGNSSEMRNDLNKFLNFPELLSEIRLEDIVNQLMLLVGRVVEDSLHRSYSESTEGTTSKQMKKRNRAARYEQYFSNAAKNTSSALSVMDTGAADSDDNQKSNKVNPAALVVQYGFSFLSSLSCLVPETVEFIQTNEHFAPSLRHSLVETLDDAIRDMMSKGVLSLCRTSLRSEGDKSLDFCQLVINSLLSFLERLFSSEQKDAGIGSEYFYLFSELLVLCPQLPDLSDPLLPKDYLRHVSIQNLPLVLCELLMTSSPPLGETSEEEDEEDKLLQGLLLVFGAYLDGLSVISDEAALSLRALCAETKRFLGIQKGLVLFLFNDCLFSTTTERKNITQGGVVQNSIIPKCKSMKSRDLCFSLLYELAKDSSENCSLLLRLVRPHHSLFRDSSSLIADIDSTSNEYTISTTNASQFLQKHGREMFIPKSKTGYCGLQNPGCICYMNSTIQQLFMIPEFRRKILDVDICGDDNGNVDNVSLSADELQDNVLYQLQLLFACLQESDKVFVEPDDLCAAIKDYEGQPTDVSVQQDASEFVSNFFQQLEGNLMSTRQESLLKEVFGGVFCNELLAAGGKRSERLEPFFMISVPVGQGKNSLEEGLKSFIAGETVDYTWESKKDPNDSSNDPKNVIKESLPTTKRTSIKTLPNHLIIHLKRFEFDFETMQQIKINQRFSFPNTLDLYPYTISGREDSSEETQKAESSESESILPGDCLYELSGVVVHVGTAHSGHYYSFIKDRGGGGARKAKSEGSNWFEFNDSFVSEFDVDDLEEECFGGEEKWTSIAGKGMAATGRHKVERSRNAFMLVYDRVKPVTEGATALKGEGVVSPSNSVQTVSAGRALIEKIWQDNMAFWRTKSIFNPGYYDFLADLLQVSNLLGSGNRLLDCQILECVIAFTFGTLTVAHEKDRIIMWTNWIVEKVLRRFPWCSFHLMNMLCANWTGSQDLPSDNSPTSARKKFKGHPLRTVLLDVDDGDVRTAVMKVIVVGMEVMLHSNRESYSGITIADSSSSEDSLVATSGGRRRMNEDPRVTCLDFVMELISLTRIAQLTWRNISVFFLPIAVLAKHSTRAKAIMQNRNFLAILLSLFLGVDTPYPSLVGGTEPGNHKSRAMSDGYNSPDFSSLLKAMLALLPTRRLSDPAAIAEGHRNRGRSMSSDTENWIRGIEGQSPSLTGGPSDPSTLGKYCDTLTEEAHDMITSQVFFYRLLKLGHSVDKILPFFNCALSESESTSKVSSPISSPLPATLAPQAFADLIVSYMKKEDGLHLKLPLRGVLAALKVADSLQEWRADLLLRTVVNEMTSCSHFVSATETSISMLLRCAKHSFAARCWLRSHREKVKWIEGWLNTRRSGAYPQGSAMSKPRKTSYGSAPAASVGPSGAVVAATNLAAWRILMQSSTPVATEGQGQSPAPESGGIHNTIDLGGYWGGSGYDSDDDPSVLIGKRIKVRWAEQEFPGTVTQYNDETGCHLVLYDTGDSRASNLSTKVWSLQEK